MKVILAPLAAADLAEAHEFFRSYSSAAADRFLLQFSEALGVLSLAPRAGVVVRLRDGRRVHSWPIPPYRVYYRVKADELQVVRIYHQARRPIERRPRREPGP